MFAAKFQLTGDRALDTKFSGLESKTQKAILRPVLRETAKIYLRAIKSAAPSATGALAKSFTVRATKRTRRGTVGFNAISSALKFRGKQWYGGPVAFGHRIGKRSQAIRAKQAAEIKRRRSGITVKHRKHKGPALDQRKVVAPNPFITTAAKSVDANARMFALENIRRRIEQGAAK